MVKSKRRSMPVKPARVVAALAVMAANFNLYGLIPRPLGRYSDV
jgi:hypothetical protein